VKFQFDSLAAFIHMDGHGVYVWTCYALVYAILIYLTVSPLLQKKNFLKQQKKWQQLQKDTSSL
jgi:heme exporter protein D